ncbi:hypothetical protein K505DRAFT_11296 [Melanomma pulvis-pyrius CBS 109.77]|uniref:Uncharacterized protein n=1 Tax=Melanomma pulvis-pyrius CBS 109.77 TaxID=1314802 RepID=A0A6A6XHB3_9PLEO|nr:hypothetical protein K505DRAFT_11296 [Melanomma pulvis-pyrius CBS 109.77]
MNSPQNVEDNVETPLLLQDLDIQTPPWQSDNAWIRIPAQIIVSILRFLWAHFAHFVFLSVLITVGIFLSISVSRGDIPVGLLIALPFTAVVWAIYSRLSHERA